MIIGLESGSKDNHSVLAMTNIVKQFMQREASPFIQFLKYAIAGGMATAVDMLVFYILSWKVLPALNHDDIVVRFLKLKVHDVDIKTRSRRFIINSVIAFVFSNMTAYIINIFWVFEPGRYVWYVELGLFYLVSVVSVILGTALGWTMIRFMKLSTTFSYIGKMLAALLVNYVCRKYLIFNG